MIYASSRPSRAQPDGPPGTFEHHLWRVDKTAYGWSAPVQLPDVVNISDRLFKPSVAENGDLYFMCATTPGPKWRLYRSEWRSGAYQLAQPLSFSDWTYPDVDSYIAPDQSYILFSSRRLPDDGHEHLYVSLRQGSLWGPVQRLHYVGEDWGADDGEANAGADEKTLYFSSARSAPVNRSETRQQMHEDLMRGEAWDNGNNNVWFMSLEGLFEANGVVSPKSAQRASLTKINLSRSEGK